jgi:hypothetical protein
MFFEKSENILSYLYGATTCLQLGPVDEVLSIALYPELGSLNLAHQRPGYRCSPHPPIWILVFLATSFLVFSQF